jgi:putative oxidoreductase
MPKHFHWFERNHHWGIFLLRFFVGARLIYGVFDNVISWEHMMKFKDFLKAFHFPFPLISAVFSVYLQLIAGIMIILGFRIRYASVVMILNFVIALLVVHKNDSIEGMTPALAILFCCILFLFQGAGRISIDKS